MLTFEKSVKGGLRLVLAEKRKETPTFFYALGIAIGLHVLAFFVFHVELFKWIETPPPLTIIEASYDLGKEGAILVEEGTQMVVRKIPEPKASSLDLPVPPYTLLNFPLDSFHYNYEISTLPFDVTEEEFHPINLDGNFELYPNIYPKSKVHFSGDLAQRKLLNRSPFPVALQNPIQAIFQVKIEDKTGKIFWIDWKKRTGNAKIDQALEQWILDFQINPLPESFITSGEIEVFLS